MACIVSGVHHIDIVFRSCCGFFFFLVCVFLAFDFCRFCVVIRLFSSPPQRPMTSDFEGFSIPDFIHYIYFNSWERASIFPFECSVLNQGTTGTIFITYLVWRGPWLGIEPGTSALEARTIPLGSHRFPLKRDLTDITVLCQYRQKLVHMERDNPKCHWSKEVHYSDKTNLYIKIYL